jgi:hypothetical protein
VAAPTHWPDFPSQLSQTAALITPAALASLARKGSIQLTHVRRINTETRNPVYRLQTADDPAAVIVKWYLPQLDRFYDARYRREEKILWLLNRWLPERVPQLYGGLITAEFAVLLQQDVGEQTMTNSLAEAPNDARRLDLAQQGLDLLAQFRRVGQEHYQAFYRTCYSIDLDRLTPNTYFRRAKIALGRLLLLQALLQDKLSAGQAIQTHGSFIETMTTQCIKASFFEQYRRRVIAPLASAPRQILHNAFSPFHLLWHENWRLIDFETMSVGAAQIDLAEFVGAPELTLSPDQTLALVERYYELTANPEPWPIFVTNFYNALASRSLDYVGTAAYQCVKYMAQQADDKAQRLLHRTRQYRARLIEALEHSEASALAGEIPRINIS